MTNIPLKAAARGRSIVHSNERYRDDTNSLEDVLADLLHYAVADGVDFDEALIQARQTCRQESGNG